MDVRQTARVIMKPLFILPIIASFTRASCLEQLQKKTQNYFLKNTEKLMIHI